MGAKTGIAGTDEKKSSFLCLDYESVKNLL